jgi:hypothetical protein
LYAATDTHATIEELLKAVYCTPCSLTIPVYARERNMNVVFCVNFNVISAVKSWWQQWNMKINGRKTHAIYMYFSGRFRVPEEIQIMLATIQSGTFCLLLCCLKT